VRDLRIVEDRVCPLSNRQRDSSRRYAGAVKTRYLLIISLATALVILGASAVWFLMAVN
jgi:hypothetical protein